MCAPVGQTDCDMATELARNELYEFHTRMKEDRFSDRMARRQIGVVLRPGVKKTQPTSSPNSPDNKYLYWAALKETTASKFWKRAWIIQEVVLSKKIGMLCTCGWLVDLRYLLAKLERREKPAESVFGSKDFASWHNITSNLQKKHGGSDEDKKIDVDLATALNISSSCGCSIPRDRIYSDISILPDSTDKNRIVVDYSHSDEKVLWLACRFVWHQCPASRDPIKKVVEADEASRYRRLKQFFSTCKLVFESLRFCSQHLKEQQIQVQESGKSSQDLLDRFDSLKSTTHWCYGKDDRICIGLPFTIDGVSILFLFRVEGPWFVP